VLTFNCARLALAKTLASWPGVRSGATAALSAVMLGMIWSAAHADGMALGGCVGGTGSLNCVVRWGEAGDPFIRIVPPPLNDVERTRAAERDRKWEERCRPTIAQDRYGVPRYHYAAPGCDFGIIQ